MRTCESCWSKARITVWARLGRTATAAAGMVAGLLLGSAATKLLESMLFEVQPHDASVLMAGIALLSAIALLACFVPAWRATRVDPVVALRAAE